MLLSEPSDVLCNFVFQQEISRIKKYVYIFVNKPFHQISKIVHKLQVRMGGVW